MKNTYIIIVTYNAMRRSWIDRCIQSIRESTVAATSIVIDNGSTDGTRDYVPQAFPEVVWLPQDRNLGFGQANNIGIRYALEHQADYVLLLNQDARLHPNALGCLIQADDGKSLLSPIQLNGDSTSLDGMFKKTLCLADNKLFDDLITGKELKNSYATERFAAACWFLPIQIINTVGGFNPLFFHYGEDDNYYFRTKYFGFDTRIVTHAVMYHDRGLHGDNELFNNHAVRRDLLNIFCDINNSFSKSLIKWANQLVRCYYNYSRQRSSYRPGAFTCESFWTAFHVSAIIKSRRKEKQKGLTWL